MQGTSELKRRFEKARQEMRDNPPPMCKCPKCDKPALVREVEALQGRCFECDKAFKERKEKLDWLYQPDMCGMSAEERRLSFSKLQPGYQNDGILSSLSQWDVARAKGYGIFLAGNIGTGKTTLAKCIINRHILSTLTRGMFFSYPRMFSDLKENMDKKNNSRSILGHAREAELLVIDDLGVGAKARWAEDELLPVIDSRWASRKPTIFTCNMLMEPVGVSGGRLSVLTSDRITGRFLDRIKQAVEVQLVLTGDSIRGRANAA